MNGSSLAEKKFLSRCLTRRMAALENRRMQTRLKAARLRLCASVEDLDLRPTGALDVGSYATHEAFLNATENAFREQFLQEHDGAGDVGRKGLITHSPANS